MPCRLNAISGRMFLMAHYGFKIFFPTAFSIYANMIADAVFAEVCRKLRALRNMRAASSSLCASSLSEVKRKFGWMFPSLYVPLPRDPGGVFHNFPYPSEHVRDFYQWITVSSMARSDKSNAAPNADLLKPQFVSLLLVLRCRIFAPYFWRLS